MGADLAFPEVAGKRTAIGGALGSYVRALRRDAVKDEQLALAFLRVAQLIDPPAALLTPKLVLRPLLANVRAANRAPQLPPRDSFYPETQAS